MTTTISKYEDELSALRQENTRLRDENNNLSDELHNLENKYSRVLIEGTQKEQESRPMRMLHNAQDGVFFSNSAGDVVFINPYLSTILGLDGDEQKLIGRPLPTKVWDDDRDLASINSDLASYGQIKDRLIIMRNANSGERVYISLSSVAVRDPYGKMVGAQHVLCNITSKMRITEELQMRNQFLAVLTNFIALIKGNADLHTLLSQSLAKLLEAMSITTYVAVYLRDRQNGAAILVAEHNQADDTPDTDANMAIAAQAINGGEVVRKALRREGGVSVTTGVPMLVAGNTVGVLLVTGPSVKSYSDSEMEMLTLVAAELGLAVEYNWLRNGAKGLLTVQTCR